MKEFLEDSTIEENRIAAEVTLYADKIAVDEEIVRLQSHISSMTDVLESDESIGRKLDFMAQEMNRDCLLYTSYVCKNIRNRKFSSRKISEQR